MKIKYLLFMMLPLVSACHSGEGDPDAYGNFEATEIFVTPEVGGKINQMAFEEGDLLAAGDLMVTIDTVTLLLKRDQLVASKLAAQSKLEQVKASQEVLMAQKEILEKDFQRLSNMLEDGAATQKQYDDVAGQMVVIDRQVKSHQAQLNSIVAEVAVVDTQIAALEDQLSRCRVRMPVRGTILQKFNQMGELAVAGKPLAKVADLERLYLRAYVSGNQLPNIKIGQKVTVLIDRDKKTNQSLEGTITWIASSAEFTPKIIQTKEERVDQVYAIKVLVLNDGRVKIGMPGEVKF